MLIRWIFFILISAFSNTINAFESIEHKQLGDLAYHIAIKVYCEENSGDKVCSKDVQANWFYDPIGMVVEEKIHPPVSYGDIVMCVDYFLTPEKLLAGRENSLIRHAHTDDGKHPRHGELFPEDITDLKFNYWERCSPAITNFEGARAGHVNHTHFQAELLTAQRTDHMLALMLRASDDNPFGALVANAISDHYLQDSFAPGHITTWRARLTDIAANAYHDRNNREGWPIRLDGKALVSVSAIPGGKRGVNLVDKTLLLLREDSCIRQNFFGSTDVKINSKGSGCNQILISESSRLEKIEKFVQEVNDSTKSDATISVKLKGDGQLWSDAQDEQRLVMLWIEVRAIFDVLESHPSSAGDSGEVRSVVLKDSFAKSSWQWDFENPTDSKIAATDFFGLYVAPSKISATIGPVKYIIPQREKDDEKKESDQTWLNYRKLDTIWGVSFGIDNMTFGDTQNRKVLAFEAVVGGKVSYNRFSENYAILAGIQPYSGPGKDGFALTSRLAWVRPETETSVSAFLRALHLGRDGLPAKWRPNAGLRLDLGFSSFLTSYLQGSRDAAVQRDGTIRSGWSIGAGLQLGAPTCRIPGASYMNMCN